MIGRIAPPGIKNVVAVGSGKGGVGKTTTAVQLALALQYCGARVGVFDADIFGPNVPMLLGIHQTRSREEAYAPILRRGEATPYIEPVIRFGLQIMSVGLLIGENQVINPIGSTVGQLVLQTMHDVLWGDLDYLIIDLPPSAGEPQNTLLNKVRLDGIILVSTPQDMSLLDAGRSARFFENGGTPVLGLIENMSYYICPSCGDKHPIFPSSRRFESKNLAALPLLGEIPFQADVAQAISRDHPLVRGDHTDPIAGEFIRIARQTALFLPFEE